VQLEQQELLELLEQRVRLELPELQVQLEPQVPLEAQVLQVPLVPPAAALLETRVQLVPQV